LFWPTPLASLPFLVHGVMFWRRYIEKKGWYLNDYVAEWYLSGAEALAALVYNCEMKRPVTILLPAFFCGQSLRFLRQGNAVILFYPLTNTLQPDYEWIKSLLEKQQVDFFLHVHYFGQINFQDESRLLCDKYGMCLIEDCAHIIHHSICKQWRGDFLLFSPHKFFPVAHGGLLYTKKQYRYHKTESVAFFPWQWYMKQFIKRYLCFFRRKSEKRKISWSSQSETPSFQSPSAVEKVLLESVVDDLEQIVEKRRQNRKTLTNLLLKYDNWMEISNFRSDDVPYLLGMRCSGLDVANERYTAFAKSGVPVMQWPDLPAEIMYSNETYKNDIKRTEEIIYFFLHEQLDIVQYVKCIRDVLNEL